jgi:hypothetical protein
MKTSVKFLLAVCAITTMLSCKKGEDDPLFSLRSRKARVTGDWKMTSGSSTSASDPSKVTTYNGTTATEGKDTYPFTFKISFKKDGSFSYEVLTDNYHMSCKGTWDFTTGIGEYKNKEQLFLTITSRSDTYESITYSGTGEHETFDIKELRNKKMVLTYHSIWEGSGYPTSGFRDEFVMEQ